MRSAWPFRPLASYLVLLTLRMVEGAVQRRETVILTDGAGHITSPNYPNDYPPNSDLQWLIAAPNGKKIRVHLEEFTLERFRDLLQFYNGPKSGRNEKPFAEITGRCSKSHPDECLSEDIVSDRNIVRVRFISDHSHQYQGFNLTYSVA